MNCYCEKCVYCDKNEIGGTLKCVNKNNKSFQHKLSTNNVLDHSCDLCNITEWCEQKISLDIHHVNGDVPNQSITNLHLLCPNCMQITL